MTFDIVAGSDGGGGSGGAGRGGSEVEAAEAVRMYCCFPAETHCSPSRTDRRQTLSLSWILTRTPAVIVSFLLFFHDQNW